MQGPYTVTRLTNAATERIENDPKIIFNDQLVVWREHWPQPTPLQFPHGGGNLRAQTSPTTPNILQQPFQPQHRAISPVITPHQLNLTDDEATEENNSFDGNTSLHRHFGAGARRDPPN